MPKLVLKDAFIEVDGTDFSDHISQVEVALEKDDIDTTNLGGDGRERAHGLKNDRFVLTFQQDFDAASVDAVLFPLYDGETEFVVTVRPTSDPIGATNPEYSATCILLNYSPLDGSVGELSTTQVTFHAQRSGVARANV